MKWLANIISIVFHPIYMPVYMSYVIVHFLPQYFPLLHGKHYNIMLGMLAMLMVGFPLISIAIMRGLGMIQSFKMEDSKERFIPMIAVATFYLWAYFMYKPTSKMVFSSDPMLANMILGSVIGVFFAFIFNSFYKISFHTIAAGAFVSLVVSILPYSSFDMTLLLIASILIAGAVASARLYLKEHTTKEVNAGLLAGYFAMFFAYQVYGKIAAFFGA